LYYGFILIHNLDIETGVLFLLNLSLVKVIKDGDTFEK